uniref:Bromodomain and WD repeat-containing protein 1 n=1 Tax=Rhizophora mucronata TaxID=61149 RepID=A0A2P2LT87_RHIMU
MPTEGALPKGMYFRRAIFPFAMCKQINQRIGTAKPKRFLQKFESHGAEYPNTFLSSSMSRILRQKRCV